MKQKVKIVLKYSNYSCDNQNRKKGDRYTSVSYNAKSYGGASPCDTDEEVYDSIMYAKEAIEKNGDKWEIIDLRGLPFSQITKQIKPEIINCGNVGG